MADETPGTSVDEPEPAGHQLYWAVANGDVDQLQALCSRWSGQGDHLNWSHPEDNGLTPLHKACDSPQCTAILLSTPGIDVNKGTNHGWTPLWWAAHNGYPETVQALLAAPGKDETGKDRPPLDPPLDLNKAPTEGGWEGRSPLTIAKENHLEREGCQEVVRLLEAAGALA